MRSIWKSRRSPSSGIPEAIARNTAIEPACEPIAARVLVWSAGRDQSGFRPVRMSACKPARFCRSGCKPDTLPNRADSVGLKPDLPTHRYGGKEKGEIALAVCQRRFQPCQPPPSALQFHRRQQPVAFFLDQVERGVVGIACATSTSRNAE